MRKPLAGIVLVGVGLLLVDCGKAPERPAEVVQGTGKAAKSAVVPPETHIFLTGILQFLRKPNEPVVASIPKVDYVKTADYYKDEANHTADMDIPIHQAFIVVDTLTNSFESTVIQPTYVNSHYAVFWVDDLDLRILHEDASPFQWNETRNVNCNGLNTYDTVPHIGRFCDCSKGPKTDKPTLLIPLTAGSTQAFVTAKYASYFKVKGGNPVWTQRVAQVVDWTVPLTSHDLVFTAASISGGGAFNHLLTIHPSLDNRIVVVIGSAAKSDLTDVLNGTASGMDVDHHFEIYYDRCTKVDQGKPVPHKGGPCDADDTSGTWIPAWLKPNPQLVIPGSVNCGPDQWP
jgi:hypothetical protein